MKENSSKDIPAKTLVDFEKEVAVINSNESEPLPIQWLQLLEFLFIHILGVLALFTFSWTNFFVMIVLFWLTLGWGIAIGYHRLLTHRSFLVPKWFEYSLAILGSMALQRGVINWVTTHRIHHAFTETNKDPHSPIGGLLWAHIGWMIAGNRQNHSPETCQKYTPDLLKINFYRSFEKVNRLPTVLLAILLFWFGGWGLVFWGIGSRTVLSWHFTWAVNSIGHSVGVQRFKSDEGSRNNWILGLLTLGDGWHNNHHAFPTSARHGFA